MSSVIYLGQIEGHSALIFGGDELGDVLHAINFYRDTGLNRTVAGGNIRGCPGVLRQLRTGHSGLLRLENGKTIDVVVQRISLDEGYAQITVADPAPAF